MADYKRAKCPHCGKPSIGTYRIDTAKQTTHITCQSCHGRYVVIHGNGIFKVEKK